MDWYPWFPSLYQADTLHLTPAQDGLYRRLIDWYMTHRRPLPDDDRALASICRITVAEWNDASSMLRAFFKHRRGLLHLKRCDELLSEQDAKSKQRSEVAKKGAEKRWANKSQKTANKHDAESMPGACSSDADAVLKNARGQDKTITPPNGGVARKRAARTDLASHEFTEAEREIVKGFGLDPETVLAKVRNWAVNAEPRKRRKADVAAFLRNWCADEKPAPAAAKSEPPPKPIVTPDCWTNGFAAALDRAPANVQHWLRQCVPSKDGDALILEAENGFIAGQLQGRYMIEVSKIWPGAVKIVTRPA